MPDFASSVFINCPFDKGYLPLLRPLIFAVLYLGLTPRLALESADAAEARIEKIIRIITESRFGIHDLSRCQALTKGELYRLNMPLELGLDIGCRRFRQGKWQTKRCLILETENYRYRAAISDLSGSDIFAHADDPEQLVKGVRDWLVLEAAVPPQSASVIHGAFLDFTAETDRKLRAEGIPGRRNPDFPCDGTQDSHGGLDQDEPAPPVFAAATPPDEDYSPPRRMMVIRSMQLGTTEREVR